MSDPSEPVRYEQTEHVVTALQWGPVSKIVPSGELLTEARRIEKRPPRFTVE